jgi:acyl-CoA reductase-like NAD-dependent aldehyde dehydrogenase
MTDFSNLVRQANLINAQWVGADDAGTFAVINPATAETIAHVPNCGATESRRAIAAANATEYGLATYAYTRDLARAFRLQDRLD